MASQSSTRSRRMPLDEFLARVDDKPYLEYLDGEVIEKPVAGKRHGRLAGQLQHALYEYSQAHGGWSGPEVECPFYDGSRRYYRVPDLAYWAPEKPEGEGDIALPPTLAVEIRSPGQPLVDLEEKCRFMASHGADACWLLDPASRRAMTVSGEGEAWIAPPAKLRAAALPGFEMDLEQLFAGVDAER